MNKYSFYLCLVLAAASTASIAHEYRFFRHGTYQKTLTIESAVAIALKERPSIVKFNFDISSAHDTSKAALAGYAPQVSFHAGTGRAKLDFFSPKSDMELTFKQLLYSFSGPLQQYQIDEEDVLALEANRIGEQNRSRYEIETSMIDLWNVRAKEFAIRQYTISSRETYKRDAHQQKIGLLDLVDWMQATATFEFAQSIIKEYQDNVTIAQSSAERSVGIGPWNDLELANSALEKYIEDAILDAPHYESNGCFAQALNFRPELEANFHAIQKALYQEQFFERSYLPSIGLFFDLYHYVYEQSCCTQPNICNPGSTLLGDLNKFTGWRLGFSLDWTFDGLGNTFNASAAELRSSALTVQRLDIIDQIKKEVTTSQSSLEIALKDLTAAKASYDQAKTQYELQKIKYDVGLISEVDMQNAQLFWDKAQIDYVDSKVAVAKKRSELLLACGYPKER